MSRSIVAANIVERDADKYHLCERSMRTILHVHGAWKPARRGVEEIYEMECVCVYIDRKGGFFRDAWQRR